jgi:serine/threonine protein phosphatase 1
MATFATGDIHGNLSALEDLVVKVMPMLGLDDTLVFLGDYIDRGPDTRGCLDRIVRLREEADRAVVMLLGNHEESGESRNNDLAAAGLSRWLLWTGAGGIRALGQFGHG